MRLRVMVENIIGACLDWLFENLDKRPVIVCEKCETYPCACPKEGE